LAPALRAGPPDRETVKSAQVHYLQGMMLEKRGSYAEALKSYEQALAEDPDSAYICRETADLALEMGLADKALELAKRAVALEPKAADGHVLLGRIHWAKGDVDAARTSFEAALKLDPRSGEYIFSLGSLLAARYPDKARRLVEDFLKDNPAQAAEAHYQIAKIDIDAGRYHEAEQHLKTAIDLEPDTDALPVRYALAQAYEARRSTDEALGAYLEILKGDPRNVALIDHVGEIYVVKDQWDDARSYFLSAKALQPAEPSANHWLALDAERRGDFAAAGAYLKASSALAEEPGLSLRLSYYLTQAGRLKDAVAVLEKAHKRWPENDQVTYFLALGYEDVKRDSSAVDLLRGVVALKPDWREARYQLAVLLEKAGDIVAAEKEFRALLARKPDDAAILNYLGYSLADKGLKLDEAEQMILEALRLDPQNGAYQDSLGWVHFKQGRSTEAVKELLEAAAQLPEDESVWEHVGDAYKRGGLPASAWFAYKRSESLAAPEALKPRKAADLQEGFTAEQLGAYYLDYLKVTQGALRKVSGICDISGEILGKPFS
jgi:tetratricopeptide (TPR) repeat protein